MNQFKKFCTGSETNCTKGKIELQHMHSPLASLWNIVILMYVHI